MGTSDGTIIGTTQIINNGSAAQRWNLVILGDGYQQAQLAQFHTDAQNFANAVLSTPPFDGLRTAINVFRIDVSSTDSGADDPALCGGTGTTARTYFDAAFCNNGIRRLLEVNNSTVINVANAQVPQWHMLIVIVNSTVYGGSGGQVACFSLAAGANEIGLHEMGHTAFGFADEYEYYQGCGIDADRNNHPNSEPVEPNVTVNSNRDTIKWRDLIASTTAMPTTRNANCAMCDPQANPVAAATVGAFEGAHYYHCGAFRPQFNCRMRALGNPFCAVCQQVIRNTLTPFLTRVAFGKVLRASQDADGRLEVFYAGTDDVLYHTWQVVPNGGWSGESLLGAPTNKGRQLAVARNADGRLEVFYVGTNNVLYHTWQITPNGGWSGENLLGSPTNQGKQIAAARNQDGRLEVFYVGTNNVLYHTWQVTPNGGWSGEHLLGAPTNQGKQIVAAQNADGRLEVFYLGTNDVVYHTWQVTPNGGWSGESLLGSSTNQGKQLSAARNADGRLEVFYIGTDNGLYHTWQVVPNGGWSGEHLLGTPTNKGKQIVAAQNQDGRLEVFYIGTDDVLYHTWQVTPNGGWSGERLLGTSTNKGKQLSAARNADGRLEVFYIGTDNALYHTWQVTPNGGWSGESHL